MSHGLNIHDGTGIIAKDPAAGILLAYGDTVPSDATVGYAPGCHFIQTDGATEATIWYANVGTKASANFDAIDLNISESAFLSGVTAGTGAASKAVVLDASADWFGPDGTSLVLGHTAKETVSTGDGATDLIPDLQVLGTGYADSSLLLGQFSTTDAQAPVLALVKGGNAAIGSHTIVADNEYLGRIIAYGDDGVDIETPAAEIRFVVDGTPAADQLGGSIEIFTTPDGSSTPTERARFTSAGDLRIADACGVIVGSTTAQVTISDGDGTTNLIPEVQVLGTTKADGSLLLMVNSATATSAAAPSVNLVKSAHATIGSNTIVASGEVLGEVNFFGADGTDFESCAVSIRGIANTTPGVGDMPGRLSIFTSTDGAETPTERVRVTGTATASTLALGVAGATTGTITLAGTTSGVVTIQALAAAGTYTLSLPPDDGDAGEQLQTDGSGVMTWEAAGSLRAVKNVIEDLGDKAGEALARIVDRGVYAFTYKEKARPTTGDYQTIYHGVMADEYPEVMHHNGRIFSPVSAFGEAVLAIKALASKVESLEAQLAGT